jgi:PAS domain S-box-containing protein
MPIEGWIFGGIIGLLVGAAGTILLLRRQQKVRSRHLNLANSELQKSEERYRTLARISPVGVFRTDPNGSMTYVNPKWCEISGLSPDQAMGNGWLDAVHSDDKEKLSKGWQESTQSHQVSFSDYRFVRPDGTIAWVMGQAAPEMNSENQTVGYVGTITDISKRKRAEAALQASERQLSLIYSNTSDVLFYLAVEPDDGFRFVSVNSAFLKATGLTEDQVVGKRVQEVIPEPARALVLENYKQAIRTKKAVGWQEVSVYPAGEKYGEASVSPFLDASGNCTHLIGTVHDITERVDAEIELRHLNAELEQRVADRTEELNAALHQAQQADRLKSAFLATMSHELRTPLNSIIGFTGVLLQGLAGPLNAEQTKQLGITRDSARHLLTLINDVLDISVIEAGQLEVARAPFEMRAVIEDALRSVSPQAQKKGLTITAAIASNVGVVVSDRRRVEQILLNLLNNAIKFTRQGQVRLECRRLEGWLETSVHDTGIGIHPEDLGKLFQPFHQLENGLNRRHEGTGLGLAICKNLVELLGGQIRAESEWGTGSTFTFTLPLEPEGASHG